MIDFQVHGSVKIKDAKKHSHSGILPKSQNAVTKKRGVGEKKLAKIYVLGIRNNIS